ncbi:MAG: AraC family transcriptional regulator [Marinoscillum sp.]|jgi:AraC family transcriptional regulator
MVCPRCIQAVKDSLTNSNIEFESVALGEVKLQKSINENEKSRLGAELLKKGFELLEDGNSALIANIKGLIMEQIHYAHEPLKVNFSDYLSEKLNREYSSLSKLFSSVESITIEKFIAAQRIERVKELLIYNEKTLSQIAFIMDYSSVAHLSSNFKKETGMTPSAFKKDHKNSRKSLDQL